MIKTGKIILLLITLQSPLIFCSTSKNKIEYIYFKSAIESFHLKTGSTKATSESIEKRVKNKKVGKAIMVNWGLILADSINYWSKYTKWLEDWQFKLTWKDQKRRFFTTEAIKFDSNPFLTNWTHGVSGAAFYSIARYYRLNIFESLLFELSSSLSWEYITEWREVISINDVFFSGIGGIPIGEPLYQYSKYLLSRRGVIPKIAGYLINPLFALNDLIGSKKWRKRFPEDYPHAPVTSLYTGFEKSSYKNSSAENLNMFHLGINTEFNKIPWNEMKNSDSDSLRLPKTFYTSISFDLSISSSGVEEFIFETEAAITGKAVRKRNPGKNSLFSDMKIYFGLSTGFELFKKRATADYDMGEYHYDFTAGQQPPQPTEFTDKLAVINLAGPVFNMQASNGKTVLKIKMNAFFNFSLVGSNALNSYSEANDIFEKREKTTLSHYGYYYAFGYTLKNFIEINSGIFRFSGLLKYQRFASIQGVDRFQNLIEDDSKAADSRTFSRFSIGFRIPGTPFLISGNLETNRRFGSFKDTSVITSENRSYLGLSFQFR